MTDDDDFDGLAAEYVVGSLGPASGRRSLPAAGGM